MVIAKLLSSFQALTSTFSLAAGSFMAQRFNYYCPFCCALWYALETGHQITSGSMHLCFFRVLSSNGSSNTQYFKFENTTLQKIKITHSSSHNYNIPGSRAEMQISKLKLSRRSWDQIFGHQKTFGNVRNLPLIYKLQNQRSRIIKLSKLLLYVIIISNGT